MTWMTVSNLNLGIAMLIAYIPFVYGMYKQFREDYKKDDHRTVKKTT